MVVGALPPTLALGRVMCVTRQPPPHLYFDMVHYAIFGITACLMSTNSDNWPEDHKWSTNWGDVTCPTCIEGMRDIVTFEVHNTTKGTRFLCLRCRSFSYHPEDVKNCYCARCGVFHRSLWPPIRAAWLKTKPDDQDGGLLI